MNLDNLTDDAREDMVNPYLIACLEEIQAKLEALEARIDSYHPPK